MRKTRSKMMPISDVGARDRPLKYVLADET